MSPCCGRPGNSAKKGASTYYERYAYLSSAQKNKQQKATESYCDSCDAYTTGEACSVCGKDKTEAKEGE